MSFNFEELNSLPVKDRIDKLNEIKDEVERELTKARKNLQENYIYCKKCNQYHPKEYLQTISRTETSVGECVFTDAGYGDYDEFADVIYLVTSYVCPSCGSNIEKGRTTLYTSNRRDRWGNKL